MTSLLMLAQDEGQTTVRNFQIAALKTRVELKFSPVINLDKKRRFRKYQVGHLPGLYFT